MPEPPADGIDHLGDRVLVGDVGQRGRRVPTGSHDVVGDGLGLMAVLAAVHDDVGTG